jgi:phosphotriesterase-related protein
MAQLVTGLIDPSELGITLTHEHLLVDLNPAGRVPREASRKGSALAPYDTQNSWALAHGRENLDDERLLDEDEAILEASFFQRAGGRTIVDATTIGIGPDPLGLARIARATGLNVIRGAGYYTMEVPQPGLDEKSEDEIAAEIVRDIDEGVGWPAVRAGIIGEIASSWPRHPNEEKVLRASVAAQNATGAPLLIHPGRDPRAPIELMDIVAKAGGTPARTIMSHIDRTIFDYDTLRELAETGVYIEYDLFGQEQSFYPYDLKVDMPNDARRIDHIMWLFEHGFGERVVVAHDVCNKHRLRKRGGHGYAHLIENVAPMMRRKGMTLEQIETVFVANPARVLAFA